MPIGELILGAAVAGATEAGKAGTAAFEAENDAHSLAIVNLSSFNFRVRPNTTKPVKGQWMDAPGDVPSLLDVFEEIPGLEDKDVTDIAAGLGDSGHGLKPWTTGVLAKAGGGWGPASLAAYDIYDKNQPTKSILVVMVLTRPGWNYTAGVAIDLIERQDGVYHTAEDTGWDLYRIIETGDDTPSEAPPGNWGKKFSDGPRFAVKALVAGQTLTVDFQPAKNAVFRITDNRPLNDELARMIAKNKRAEAKESGR